MTLPDAAARLAPLAQPGPGWQCQTMSKVTNLNQFRKQKTRSAARAQGDANAARFGRTKAEREAEELRRDTARNLLDGHRLSEERPEATETPKSPDDAS